MFDSLAYIDPGTGSLLVQAIIGTLVAVPYLLRRQLARLIRAFGGPQSVASSETVERREETGAGDDR